MHEFLFFDTETTSLLDARRDKPGGEVIQFAGILVGDDFTIRKVINRYCSSTQLIDPRAENVHKLSDKKISILSDGKFFETVVEEEKLRSFDNITWVAYNLGFDTRKMNQTLTQNGYEPINFGTSTSRLDFNAEGIFKYDAMEPLRCIHKSSHKVKLQALVDAHIGADVFKQICLQFRTKYGIIDPLIGQEDYFHNAFFDTLGLLLLVNKFRNLLLR